MRFVHNFITSILLWKAKHKGEYLFRQWILLEGIKAKIIGAVENNQPEFSDYILDYISTALGVRSKWFAVADWLRTIELFYVCLSKAPIVKIPLTSPTQEPYKDDPWTYDGRTWHLYSHLLAKEYGWSLEYISQLHVSEALAKIQEILTDVQLEREFLYGLSEVAYQYDSGSKKSTFKPMSRPYWMKEQIKEVPRFKIPKTMLPQGAVILDGVLPDEYLPKEIH